MLFYRLTRFKIVMYTGFAFHVKEVEPDILPPIKLHLHWPCVGGGGK